MMAAAALCRSVSLMPVAQANYQRNRRQKQANERAQYCFKVTIESESENLRISGYSRDFEHITRLAQDVANDYMHEAVPEASLTFLARKCPRRNGAVQVVFLKCGPD
jgi:hypothetical protein